MRPAQRCLLRTCLFLEKALEEVPSSQKIPGYWVRRIREDDGPRSADGIPDSFLYLIGDGG